MARALYCLVPLLALPLAACAGKPMRTGGPLPPTLACDPAPARWAIGKVAGADVLERIRLDSHAQVVRVIRPGQVVTMEFSAGRVDVRVDASDVVLGVSCG
jgi:Peptidase inhibitor I78 family